MPFELVSIDLLASVLMAIMRVYLTDADFSSVFLMAHYQLCLASSTLMMALATWEGFDAVSNMVAALRAATATNQRLMKTIMAPDFWAPIALLKHDDAGTRVVAVNQSMLNCSESRDLWGFMQMLELKEITQKAGSALESRKESDKGPNEVQIMSKQTNDESCFKADWKIFYIQDGYGLLLYLKDYPFSLKSCCSSSFNESDSDKGLMGSI